ncbi:MAG: response regulator, partial [Coleofasciculaceae cyanobacterium]
WTPTEAAEEDWTLTEAAEEDWTPTEALDESWQDLEVLAAEFETSAETAGEVEQDTAAEFETSSEAAAEVEQSTEDDVFEQELVASASSASLSREVQSEREEVLATDSAAWAAPSMASSTPAGAKRRKEVKSDSTSSTRSAESQENTVRIPVRQLDRLGDLFGELTIERNGLSLHLERLRSLMETLRSRVSTLEQSNQRLRTTYDKVATQANTIPAAAKSLAAAMAPNGGGTPNYNQVWANYSYSDILENPSRTGLFNTPNAGVGEGMASLEPGEGEGEFGDDAEDINRGFDALEMDQYSDLHLLSMEVMETIVQIQEVTSDIDLGLEDTDQTTRELNRTSKQLQTNLTRLRMRPLSDLVGRFSRALRDLSFQHGKQVELKVVGKSTLIDRSILETLSDPLMHLVRNAFDHGIETPEVRRNQGKPPQGTIEIKAAHRGNQTLITISDDGNGINLDKIRSRAEDMGLDAELLSSASEDDLLSLIFEPGFSTADQVTDLSGRGVGMDVVRNNLRQIRGDIRVDTSPGRGTTFTLTVPFTLSVARILLVESNGMLLAFPTDVIEEMLLLLPEQILKTPGSEAIQWEGEIIPLIRLGALLKFNCPRRVTTLEGLPSISDPTVMMINQDDHLVGLQVDRCWGEREVAIRKVEGTLTLPSGFSSCAILGDGKVVPLVDSSELVRSITNRDGVTQKNSVDFQNQLTPGAQSRAAFAPSTEVTEQFPTAPLPGSLPEARTPSIPSLPAFAGNLPEDTAPQNQKRTILVVDDSVNVRRFLALALEKAGYLVEQAKDGQDAVEKLLSGLQVQAVICDIEMPRLDGYGFLARIKSDPAFSDLPIAMLTSRSGEKHRQLAMTLGATAYFSKPYNERVLLQTLEQLTLPKK